MTAKYYNLTEKKVKTYNLELEAGASALLFACDEGTGKEESITIVLSQEQMNLLREVSK